MNSNSLLVVDDEPDILEFLKYNFQKEGYIVNTFSNGYSAFEFAKTNLPDIVISDWWMAETNGIDLLQLLKKNEDTKNIPFVMITCNNNEKDIVKALNLGAEDYLTKPFRISELMVRVKNILVKNAPIKHEYYFKNEFTKIEQKNKDVRDSLIAAHRIQQAMLPSENDFKSIFKDSFILYMPKDIVSGDFYWFFKEDNVIWVAIADCTGHSVEGAFMAILGNTILNQIVKENKIREPEYILNELDARICKALNYMPNATSALKHGMDIALCRVDLNTMELKFSGAMRPLTIIRENKLIELKGNRMPIGGFQLEEDRSYQAESIQIQLNDLVYMFSDGFADQFGGVKGKKYKSKQLKHLLLSSIDNSLTNQAEVLFETFNCWKENEEQCDDVLILGFRI